uniref:N-acetylglucosaminylphosphatidylinositol deacetylase n=1 Tax=Maylandia zebra TaxID=106582 RepID=A0A3P9BHA9_9CICH
MTLYLAIIIILSYLALIKCIFFRHRRTLVKSLKRALNAPSSRETNGEDIRALVVTAHPDDECMFFAPTIIRLIELNATVHLLCLSEGNYYNQGAQRKKELLNSCAVLGIPASRIIIINHKKLPDDPKAEWSVSFVSSEILKHIRAHSINMVRPTLHSHFKRTVSQTMTLCWRGTWTMASLIVSLSFLPDCTLLSLVTVGLLRKYISFLDVPLSWFLPSCVCCIIGSKPYKQAKAAMLCHRTQLLWFRYLYITFSRYMFINTFQTIAQGPKNLKIY